MRHSILRTTVCSVLAVLLAAAVLAGCSTTPATTTAPTTAPTTAAATTAPTDAAPPTEVGQGETAFDFTVTFLDGSEQVYTVRTDSTVVGDALLEAGLIAGEDSEYGLYVKTVAGETLDYDADGKYWAFYIDGEYAVTGVDATTLAEGSSYAFKAE